MLETATGYEHSANVLTFVEQIIKLFPNVCFALFGLDICTTHTKYIIFRLTRLRRKRTYSSFDASEYGVVM